MLIKSCGWKILSAFYYKPNRRIVVGSCDVEENNALAVRFSIRNVPTVLFLKNGEVVDRCVGSVPKTTLVEKLEKLL